MPKAAAAPSDGPSLPTGRAVKTRQRILDAGADLLHGFPTWNWSALTVPAVADRAAVAERTVYRYFRSERELRNAVMAQLERDAKVTLDGLRLEDISEVASRILEHSSGYPLVPRVARDETVMAAAARQRAALAGALEPYTQDWTARDRALAAGVFDVLWSVAGYERLVGDWGLDPAEAIRATVWAIRLVESAIRTGQRPD